MLTCVPIRYCLPTITNIKKIHMSIDIFAILASCVSLLRHQLCHPLIVYLLPVYAKCKVVYQLVQGSSTNALTLLAFNLSQDEYVSMLTSNCFVILLDPSPQ